MSKREGKPKVPVERPDKSAAKRPAREGAVDRPGFDLGGAEEVDENEPMRNPRSDPAENHRAPGRSGGLADPSGSRSLGNEGDAGSESGSGKTKGS